MDKFASGFQKVAALSSGERKWNAVRRHRDLRAALTAAGLVAVPTLAGAAIGKAYDVKNKKNHKDSSSKRGAMLGARLGGQAAAAVALTRLWERAWAV